MTAPSATQCAAVARSAQPTMLPGAQPQPISHITQGIWIGGYTSLDGALLQMHGIQNVCNTAIEFHKERPDLINWADMRARGIKFTHLDWDDTLAETIYPSPGMTLGIQLITDAVNKGEGILVNCAMGKSRSSSCVMGYLMTNGMSYDDALALIKRGRSSCNPNKNFERQLRSMETVLRSQGPPMPVSQPPSSSGILSPRGLSSSPSSPPRPNLPARLPLNTTNTQQQQTTPGSLLSSPPTSPTALRLSDYVPSTPTTPTTPSSQHSLTSPTRTSLNSPPMTTPPPQPKPTPTYGATHTVSPVSLASSFESLLGPSSTTAVSQPQTTATITRQVQSPPSSSQDWRTPLWNTATAGAGATALGSTTSNTTVVPNVQSTTTTAPPTSATTAAGGYSATSLRGNPYSTATLFTNNNFRPDGSRGTDTGSGLFSNNPYFQSLLSSNPYLQTILGGLTGATGQSTGGVSAAGGYGSATQPPTPAQVAAGGGSSVFGRMRWRSL
eukprot:TRINITY_DN6310_c0_g1_i1.p1 TRINITY_DN6310_c0_g1~~TRINITY_DN6310_c0_g1_i1.p1  ORF type:complete len:498 (-),score=70.56 TRINITY_DN6310_c0_g1_i1:170-1663(-)